MPEQSIPLTDPNALNLALNNGNTQSRISADNLSVFQELSQFRIDLDKLCAKLESKFGAGVCTIYLMQDVYTIKAPARLSIVHS
ncbi:hypothetical protein B0T26DRAFT_706506 [Lasiosphaeria miniovina]|uniref:Uncharacterized protein n=1 Tax=Lasiosphaeria miniovina TaxID=1954250 RepID=A0AA40AWV2_9PEZI|nr:uncharacterized protein B0T26DRAFT_706506 [Lasiosphaeria miniovina]KAK0723476.1 hypothetical protein B0T26DRAFT_706506 [Lasiosphaeria miniovina]